MDYKGFWMCIAVIVAEGILLAIFLPKFDKKIQAEWHSIVKVVYLGSGEPNRKRPRLMAILLGEAAAGFLGALAASTMTAEYHSTAQFSIEYSDGRREIKEVVVDSWEYRELMKRTN